MAIVLMAVAALLISVLVAQKFTGAALPGMGKARTGSNEVSAIASLRVINTAQASYSSTCTSGGFAVSLDDLSKLPPNQGTPFVSSDIGHNGAEKDGYVLTMEADARPGVAMTAMASSTCNGAAENPASSYFVSAEPVTPGKSGLRYFATDARGIVFESTEPIENPIIESDMVKPVQGGGALEKLNDVAHAKPEEAQ
jgi:hypothetical protein